MKRAAPPSLVRALLDEAGVAGDPTVVDVPSPGRVNTTTIVAVGGERYAVRAYGWPFDEPCAFDRRAKEAALHPRLRDVGVPVPEVLSVATVDGLDGALLSYVPGELLGVVAQRVPADDLDDAWREAAAALRQVHAVEIGSVGGFVTAAGVEPFAKGTYGQMLAAGMTVASGVPGLDDALLARVADAVVPIVDAAPLRLGHSDANPWNVLVVERDGRWRLSAWLDWELAWVADPAFDLMRVTEQRYAPIGPAPEAFWDGYGDRGDPVGIAAATLHYLLGLHAEHAAGARTPEILQGVAHGPDPAEVLRALAERLGL